MFVPGYFLLALAEIFNIVLEIYKWIVIISALISWVNPDPYNPIVRFLSSATEPVYRLIRRILPLPRMPIDISPLLVILAIVFLQYFLVRVLVRTAETLM